MIIFSIIIIFLIQLGIIIEDQKNTTKTEKFVYFMLAPILLPIILGMIIYKSVTHKND